ncbi:hypothetical protein PT974_08043 [Cladobotryum mycophilum]|uniref:Zn(2)-C6 fungal-type domain-containing protein n=1 Tax=Cladobotryum mycophilum TaxID=491253 RepID=A0ABR0SC91_9HYPO
MEYYNTRMMGRKLKDSCDLCSASKLRCGKQKPACARCASLNQLCSYSPARRAGRPHRVRREKVQQQGVVTPVVHDSQLNEPGRSPDQGSEANPDNATLLALQTTRHYQNHQQQSAEPSPCQGPDLDTGEGDCTRSALFILEQLNIARTRSGLTYTSLTITEACQRLLAILICPCSEQPGVALLLASGCISLMDTVHDLANNHFAQDTASPELSNSTTTTPSTENDMSILPMHSSSHNIVSNSHCGVEELSRIAKVISQFTDRYNQEPTSGTGWTHTTWMVAPIVALLRFRLQCITHEAARRLVF